MALDCGITVREFWEMSLDEILDSRDSFSRNYERRVKDKLSNLHFLARDTAQQISAMLAGSEDVSAPELWDYFPDLFGKEKIFADQKKREQEMAVYKAQMQDFAYRHNHIRNGGEK